MKSGYCFMWKKNSGSEEKDSHAYSALGCDRVISYFPLRQSKRALSYKVHCVSFEMENPINISYL
jgi:hypothetical protein